MTNTNTPTPADLLDRLTGHYGPTWAAGILIDNLDRVDAWGLRLHTTGTGRQYVTTGQGGRAVRVVCGHIVWIDTEDGRTDGRCGAPVVAGRGACEGHADEMDDWRGMSEAERVAWERDPARA